MNDGTELDDYEGIQFARDEKSTIYFLNSGEALPQEIEEQENNNRPIQDAGATSAIVEETSENQTR